MERESFVIYKSFYEAIKELPDDIRLVLHDAIMEYGLYGVEPSDLPPIPKSIFTLIKPQIDANNRKYENGKKGGRPKKKDADVQEPLVSENGEEKNLTETKEKPNQNQKETKEKPKNNLDETKPKPNVNVNVNDNDIEKKITNKLVIQKKKSKEEETLERRDKFYHLLIPYVSTYGKDMIMHFFDYWSEMNKSKSKMRWESEKTWELARRLEYWSRRDNSFNNSKSNANNQTSAVERKQQERNERQSDALARIMRLRAEDEAAGAS